MFFKIEEIPEKFCCIYKINYPNGKIYIGQTCNLRRRMNEHNDPNKAKSPCDLAIKKYGKISQIEVLEEIKDSSILNEREIYWIKYYNSNNKEIGYNLTKGGKSLRGEDANSAVFTNEEVFFIRKSRFEGLRKIDIYNKYFSHISFDTFEHVWLGRGYDEVGKEYFIPKNIRNRKEYSSIANAGERNNKAKLTSNDVLRIRERYNNGESWISIHKDYNFVKLNTIKRVCKRETWKTI